MNNTRKPTDSNSYRRCKGTFDAHLLIMTLIYYSFWQRQLFNFLVRWKNNQENSSMLRDFTRFKIWTFIQETKKCKISDVNYLNWISIETRSDCVQHVVYNVFVCRWHVLNKETTTKQLNATQMDLTYRHSMQIWWTQLN